MNDIRPDRTEMELQAIRDYYIGLRDRALALKTSGYDRTRGDRRADIRSRWSSTRTAIHDFYQLLVHDIRFDHGDELVMKRERGQPKEAGRG